MQLVLNVWLSWIALQDSVRIVDASLLDQQFDDFVRVMTGQCGHSKTPKVMWKDLISRTLIADDISEYCKLASVMLVIPVGSVQNERAFSQMNLIQNDLRNRLKEQHLNVAMRCCRSLVEVEALPIARCLSIFRETTRRGYSRVM